VPGSGSGRNSLGPLARRVGSMVPLTRSGDVADREVEDDTRRAKSDCATNCAEPVYELAIEARRRAKVSQ
jgi:hypothetical protein